MRLERVFVGREQELADLQAGLEEAISGHGRLFLIVGEPGIGKTRLAEEVASHATQRGGQVLWGRCWEGGGEPTYWPWVQIIRGYLWGLESETIRSRLSRFAPQIIRIVPELREYLTDVPSPEPTMATLEQEEARFALFDAVTSFLKAAAAAKPLVLVLDDLHAADYPSLLLLRFLARELTEASIMVLGTYRGFEAEGEPEIAKVLGETAREGQRMLLGRLNAADLASFVAKRFRVSPAASFVASLHQSTEGNPFFADEVVRLLASEGRLREMEALAPRNFKIPDRVKEVLRRRLEHLPSETKHALTVASALGKEFDLPFLARVLDQPLDRILRVVSEALATGAVVERQHSVGRFVFSHALIREVLYEDLALMDRAELHRRIGEALELVHATDLETHLSELAHHFGEATLAGAVDKAVHYATAAGKRAMENVADEEAVRHFQRGLAFHELRGMTKTPERCDLLLVLAYAYHGSSNRRQAKEVITTAAELARQLHNPERLARAAINWEPSSYAPIGTVDEQHISLLEEALRALPHQATPLRARVLAQLARGLEFAADAVRREAAAEEAVRVARASGDRESLAVALYALLFLTDSPKTDPRVAAARAREIIELREKVETQNGATCLLIRNLLDAGDAGAAEREIELYTRRAKELRHLVATSMSAMVHAMRATMKGQFDVVEAILSKMTSRLQPHPNAARMLGVLFFRLRFEQGRLGEIVQAVEAGAERTTSVPAYRCALAAAYAELGREADARATFENLAAHDFGNIPEDSFWFNSFCHLAIACAFLGDSPRAARLYEALSPYAGRNALSWILMYLGPVSYYLGILARTLGRHGEAECHFDDALASAARMGARPCVARTQYEYARMLVARGAAGDREKALALLDEALETARSIGMRRLTEHALALRHSADSTPEASQPARQGDTHPPLPAAFHREGDYWTIEHGGIVIRLKNAKGLCHLAYLLSRPHHEFHVLEMVAAAEGAAGDLPADALGGGGEILDSQARAAYKSRLDDLQEEIEEAERHNDLGRTAAARREIDALTQELARAVGLGGRSREAASAADRARQSVTKTIKDALRKITENNPALGRHLDASIRTGTFCSYAPSPEQPIVWKL